MVVMITLFGLAGRLWVQIQLNPEILAKILINALGNGFPPLKSADFHDFGFCQLTSADIS